MVICLERGADLHTAQLMPVPLTVSCFSKILIDFTFLVRAHLGSPGQKAVKRVCVCVLVSPALHETHPKAAYVLPVFLIYFLFKRFLSKCLKICETDLYPICRNGRTVAVNERTEVKFFDPSRDAALATICVGFIGFYPQNWVRVTFGRRRLTTRSTGKPIS